VAALVLRLRLFLSSYAPLFAILAVRFITPWLWMVLAALAVSGCLTLAFAIRALHRVEPSPHTVVEVSDQGAEVAGYLATYLPPFMTVPAPTGRDLIAYSLFLLEIAPKSSRTWETQRGTVWPAVWTGQTAAGLGD
jgi:hypothetical protein